LQVPAAKVKNPEGMALLAKHFGTTESKKPVSKTGSSTRNIKNKQVLLMKLRMKAIAADQADKSARYTPSDCILVRIDKDDKEHVFWFKKV
jgi:hypothetical protein